MPNNSKIIRKTEYCYEYLGADRTRRAPAERGTTLARRSPDGCRVAAAAWTPRAWTASARPSRCPRPTPVPLGETVSVGCKRNILRSLSCRKIKKLLVNQYKEKILIDVPSYSITEFMISNNLRFIIAKMRIGVHVSGSRSTRCTK